MMLKPNIGIYLSEVNFRFNTTIQPVAFERSTIRKPRCSDDTTCNFLQSERPKLTDCVAAKTEKSIIAKIVLTLFLLAIICFLQSCSDDNRQLRVQQKVKELKNQKPKPLDVLPTIKAIKKQTYQADHLRSPFHRPEQVKVLGRSPNLKRTKEPLEAFALDSLSMVGSITRSHVRYALIKTPDGTIYPVTVGNYVGKNFGRVIKITANKIELMESVKVGNQWQRRKASIVISTPKRTSKAN